MLNLMMTHSPQMAAMLNGKRSGEDANKSHSVRHRMAWSRKEHASRPWTAVRTAEQALRERTA